MKSSLNPDFKGGESWGGAPRPPRDGDSDSPAWVPGPPEPWEEREAAGPALRSPGPGQGPLPQFPRRTTGTATPLSAPPPPWMLVGEGGRRWGWLRTGRGRGRCSARGGSCWLWGGCRAASHLPSARACFHGGSESGSRAEDSPRVQGLWRAALPSALLLPPPRLSLLESLWICTVAAAQLAPWQWWDGYKHTWEAEDGSSVTLTAPFPPSKL